MYFQFKRVLCTQKIVDAPFIKKIHALLGTDLTANLSSLIKGLEKESSGSKELQSKETKEVQVGNFEAKTLGCTKKIEI